jgi:hypothetical protein
MKNILLLDDQTGKTTLLHTPETHRYREEECTAWIMYRFIELNKRREGEGNR